ELPTQEAGRPTARPALAERKADKLSSGADGLGPRAPAAPPGAPLARAPPAATLAPSSADARAAPESAPPSAREPERHAPRAAHAQPPTERVQPTWPAVATLGAALALALLAPLLLYHRLRGRAMSRGGTRARVAALLAERPGLSPAEAARALGVDPTTALYHLRRLVRERLALVEERRYFPAGAQRPEERARLVARRRAGHVLDAVRARPGASKSALAAALAIARPTLSLRLARLARAGLVRLEREGRSVRVYPGEALS
ncbi:MAG TPA: helix-turn-helix domain-containing protein, partial [Candidatus Thermoplasmatota archaeon]|nr:helix-turn-helix domain-containing protein [Candidatus Thermoplasmatota archaeon]